MKTSDGSLHQCDNGQAVADADHQVIVAADVSGCAADADNLIPMTEWATAATVRAPGQVLVSVGYTSEDNLAQAAELTGTTGMEFFIAPGRAKHDDPTAAAPRGPIPKNATPKQRMDRKLKT